MCPLNPHLCLSICPSRPANCSPGGAQFRRSSIHDIMPYIYIYIYTYMHACMHTYIHTYRYTYTHVHIYTYTYIYIHIYTYTHIHIYIHVYIYIYLHICIYIYLFTSSMLVNVHVYLVCIYIYCISIPLVKFRRLVASTSPQKNLLPALSMINQLVVELAAFQCKRSPRFSAVKWSVTWFRIISNSILNSHKSLWHYGFWMIMDDITVPL